MKKKTLFVLLLICFTCAFSACANSGKEKETSSGSQTEATQAPAPSSQVEDPGKEKPDNKQEVITQTPQILSLNQTYVNRYEGVDDYYKLLVSSEHSYVTVNSNETGCQKLSQELMEIGNMQTKSMDDEADNLLSFAKEELQADWENFETNVSTLDTQVRRADSVVVSILADSYSDYGFIEDYRALHGSNFDTETGEELLLSQVIRDMDKVPEIVVSELNSHLWAGEGYSKTVVEDYFKNTPEDGISWTIDYNGVTFYFMDGDISEPGNGLQTATVSFAAHPEVFEEKYMSMPDAYMVRLPMDTSFFTDLDGDGDLEELNCSGYYNPDEHCYTSIGIYSDFNGSYQYEELFAYKFNPYYVKTQDQNHYLYLFCYRESEEFSGQTELVVYNINNGKVTRVGEMNAAPAFIPMDTYVLPLNPNNILLDNFDSLAQDAEAYFVGENGMPKLK